MKSLLRTDVGLVRQNNEDAAFIGEGLYVLCDGMGGHEGGEIASNLAVDTLSGTLARQEPSVGPLIASILKANEAICKRAMAEPPLRGMGTTLTAMWVAGEQVLIGQVGDSRCYLLRGGVFRQCTHDHSMVADLVRAGQITPEEARVHPQKNLVTRALGTDLRVDPDIFEFIRQPGDRWLLCSDGLTDQVTDAEIAAVLSEKDRYDAADTLLALALSRGAPDNVTFLLIDDERGETD